MSLMAWSLSFVGDIPCSLVKRENVYWDRP